MAFPDMPFNPDLPSFISHKDVLEYLEMYTETYDLRNFVKFHTLVDTVRPLIEDSVQWEVRYRCVTDSESTAKTEMFDAVMVCCGHYSVPMFPTIPGLDVFEGRVLHSHDYREPEIFRDKTVVCLGAGSSGQDIALELSRTAKQVILSHNKKPLQSPLPDNLQQRPGIKRLGKNTVVFHDDTEVSSVDGIIFCTGYHFSFPFLTEDCKLKVEDERITPLYKHLIHTDFPSLSFVGMCKLICPFPQFHCQVLFALSVLDGSLKLPSKEEMDADTEKDFQSRLSEGLLKRYAHHMSHRQWGYNNDLADIAKFDPIPPVVEKLYEHVHNLKHDNLVGYKKINFELTGTGPGSFKEVCKYK